ncbi:hypothetical protein DAI22_11g199101 [Oryza sativa Japonica Group]|nr:hypothetical protein DAI22_11g199101 [Oryza sativa Japonica Group]
MWAPTKTSSPSPYLVQNRPLWQASSRRPHACRRCPSSSRLPPRLFFPSSVPRQVANTDAPGAPPCLLALQLPRSTVHAESVSRAHPRRVATVASPRLPCAAMPPSIPSKPPRARSGTSKPHAGPAHRSAASPPAPPSPPLLHLPEPARHQCRHHSPRHATAFWLILSPPSPSSPSARVPPRSAKPAPARAPPYGRLLARRPEPRRSIGGASPAASASAWPESHRSRRRRRRLHLAPGRRRAASGDARLRTSPRTTPAGPLRLLTPAPPSSRPPPPPRATPRSLPLGRARVEKEKRIGAATHATASKHLLLLHAPVPGDADDDDRERWRRHAPNLTGTASATPPSSFSSYGRPSRTCSIVGGSRPSLLCSAALRARQPHRLIRRLELVAAEEMARTARRVASSSPTAATPTAEDGQDGGGGGERGEGDGEDGKSGRHGTRGGSGKGWRGEKPRQSRQLRPLPRRNVSMVLDTSFTSAAIRDVDLYRAEPWDLLPPR